MAVRSFFCFWMDSWIHFLSSSFGGSCCGTNCCAVRVRICMDLSPNSLLLDTWRRMPRPQWHKLLCSGHLIQSVWIFVPKHFAFKYLALNIMSSVFQLEKQVWPETGLKIFFLWNIGSNISSTNKPPPVQRGDRGGVGLSRFVPARSKRKNIFRQIKIRRWGLFCCPLVDAEFLKFRGKCRKTVESVAFLLQFYEMSW